MVAAPPGLVAASLSRWRLRPDGPPLAGRVALVLPVRRADGTAAALKVQHVDEETVGEPAALRAWDGDGAVRLLDHHLDAATGTGLLLLERLHPTRSLASLPDDRAALEVLCGLLARLTATPAPTGLRHLRDVAAAMLDQTPRALAQLTRAEDRGWWPGARPRSRNCCRRRVTACCTGTCTTPTCWRASGSRGWRSTRSRSPATPAHTAGATSAASTSRWSRSAMSRICM